MIRALCLSAAFFSTLVIPAALTADDKPDGDDVAKIQGTWKGKAGKQGEVDVEYVFEGNAFKLRFTFPGDNKGGIDGKFKLDPMAKPHKTIDWTDLKGLAGGAPPDSLGIYVFEDENTLKICNPRAQDPRPDEFFESKGGGIGTIVLKRAKAKDARE
jgi:uncharacterized protein (TIGR03067 family)